MEQRQRRYPSDLSDYDWALIEPLVPPPKSGGPKGGRPAHPRRSIIDAILYVVRTGCAWRQLPVDFPPWQTVYGHFYTWSRDGTLDAVHDALRDQVRGLDDRDPEPTAGIVDSQSVRGADTVNTATRGYDAAKGTNGRKRHAIVDTLGLLLAVVVTAASVQDRDGGPIVARRACAGQQRLKLLWADAGYAGRFVTIARDTLALGVEVVRKHEGQRGFAVLPRRWVVERTFAWLMKCRRLAADYERTPAHAQAMIQWTMIRLMTRRLARAAGANDVTPYNW